MERDKKKRETKVKFAASKKTPQKVNIKFYTSNGPVQFTAKKKDPRKVKIKFYEK